jgi:hypothetical protein
MPYRLGRLVAALAPLGLLMLAQGMRDARAEQELKPKTPVLSGRDHVASCTKIEGALLERGKDGKLKVLKSGDPILAKTELLGFPKAELTSECKQVKIDLLLYLGDKLPLGAAAISLNDTAGFNADVILHHGIIGLKSLAAKGNAVVRVSGGDRVWTITLKDPDSAVVVARFGFHEPGTHALKMPGPEKRLVDDPLMHMGILVTKGHVSINTGSSSYEMNAPPGPAMITWDAVKGYDVQRLQQLPEEVTKFQADEEKLYKTIAATAAKVVEGDIAKNLTKLVESADSEQRRIAVGGMGAIGDLPGLVSALENPKHQDVREQAIRALRNWMSRDKGHITKLYDYLTKDKKDTAVEGRGIILMLKGFDESDRMEPVTYQLLIEAMDNRPLAMREMAHWHLVRMAPAGKNIAYDAAADEAARRRAVEQWRKLIPPGKLPPVENKKGA